MSEVTPEKQARGQPMLWGSPIEFWDLWGVRLMFVGALVGVGGLVLSAFSAYVLYRVADISQKYLASETLRLSAELAKAHEAVEVARNEAKQIDANLLREQRLTSVERWRLDRVERATLPRSLFVDWEKLEQELAKGHFDPINLAVVRWPHEAHDFGMRLMLTLHKVGLLKRFIELPFSTSPFIPFSSSGSFVIMANRDAELLADTLWRFGIGGGSGAAANLPPEWSDIPTNENCLLVLENGQWAAPPAGQSGEGADAHGRALPP